MQKEGLNNLYNILEGIVPKNVLTSKNKAKTWKYGYNSKYDFIVISKTGQIEDVIEIQGLKYSITIKPPKSVYSRRHSKERRTVLGKNRTT